MQRWPNGRTFYTAPRNKTKLLLWATLKTIPPYDEPGPVVGPGTKRLSRQGGGSKEKARDGDERRLAWRCYLLRLFVSE
jgi:hypothetical protein